MTYRLGQRPDREIRVKVERIPAARTRIRTNSERDAKADQVPPAMVNNPSADPRIWTNRLDDLVIAIAIVQGPEL